VKLTVENYVSQTGANNRFSIVVWSVTVALVCLWLGLIAAAPVLRANNFVNLANAIYTFFSFLCHQISARSFYFHDAPLAVCARCFGVYFGLALGVLIYPFFRRLNDLEPLPRIWLLLAPLPTTIDFLLDVFGIWENTHLSRFSTALILGLGCTFFLMPGVLEISRFFFQSTINSQQ
jgi:uncharacterized membrane protein